MNNYYVDGKWFARYEDAKDYANSMMWHDDTYRVVYTKAEMDSQVKEMVNSIINHEMECGK